MTAVLSSWLDRLEHLDTCPWPGPRPLRVDDRQLLVGRDDDRARFQHEVDSHRLVLLAGVSGVGKTSLLEAGLRPELEKDGRYVVVVCRDWATDGSSADRAVEFLSEKVRQALEGTEHAVTSSGVDLFWELESRHGDRLVLVLDQFEELIRFDLALKEAVCDLLLEINKRMALKLVISLRSEYLHELRGLENGAMPFSLSRYVLGDVDPVFAEDVVLAPQTATADGEPQALVIDEQVAAAVAAAWREVRGASQRLVADPFGRIGLLHLQAVLYALHAEAEGGHVGHEAHRALVRDSAGSANLFTYGVVRAIDVKLRRCEKAFRGEGLDDYRTEGVQSLLARVVPKLASGGYKLVRNARELADEVLEAELDVLTGALRQSRGAGASSGDGPVTDEQLRALKDKVLELSQERDSSLVSLSRVELARQADEAAPGPCPWEERLHQGTHPAQADPSEVSCGPVMGLAPAAVLIEELRRFSLMLSWLRATSLVRVTSPSGTGLMVSLIHDGFGEALRQWADRRRVERPAAEALHALTAPFGAFFDWIEHPVAIFHNASSHRVFANLRWRGNTVRARFRGVVFVNCDFRGTLFDGCRFEGVTLVNCRLDGTLVSDCVVSGEVTDATWKWSEEELVFLVDAAENRLLPSMESYQGLTAGAGKVFLAQLVGLPAVPAPPGASARRIEPQGGGLVVYGGRLSALTVRHTRFEQRGRVSLRHVAGSGFDLVEQGAGDLEIHGSALRHLTVTFADEVEAGTTFTMTVRDSVLAQAWVGHTVRGRVRALNSNLVQFFNASPDTVVEVAHDSGAAAGYGLTFLDEAGDVVPPEGRSAPPTPETVEAGCRMDYSRTTSNTRTAR